MDSIVRTLRLTIKAALHIPLLHSEDISGLRNSALYCLFDVQNASNLLLLPRGYFYSTPSRFQRYVVELEGTASNLEEDMIVAIGHFEIASEDHRVHLPSGRDPFSPSKHTDCTLELCDRNASFFSDTRYSYKTFYCAC